VYRDPEGKLKLSDPVKRCDANLWELAVSGKF
jgi:hypothetical protein